MGLRSVVHVIGAPVRLILHARNHFIPERTKHLDPPTEVNTDSSQKKPRGGNLHSNSKHTAESHTETLAPIHSKFDLSTIASETQIFYLRNGKTLRSIDELSVELTHMDPDTYYHHVTAERNDFSNWINDVFHADEIAKEIRSIHDPFQTRAILERHR